ncbi:MAG: hypothetical protein R3190_04500 [Thermoanaerobaculia bacterium]|nr:hypothetical protein [Thermoanaerobaculia bacterium]
MKIAVSTLLLAILAVPAVQAADVPEQPTFTRDVLPILQQNCQECHRQKPINVSGMVAPFALTSYDEARPWAKSIAKAVEARKMPPWHASEEFHGVFRNERTLDSDEIETIVRWAKTGAAKGRDEDAPPPLVFEDSEWFLGEPDVVVTLPEPVWVGDEVTDWQPNIMIPLTEDILPEDRYLRAVECQPRSEGVHHIVISAIAPEGDSGLPVGARGKGIGGLAPGSPPDLALDGYGILLEKGSTLRVNMHYFKEPGPGTGFYNQSAIGLHFYPKDAQVTEVSSDSFGTFDFEIPPGQPKWEVAHARTFENDFSVLSYLPHMHLRGVAAKYVAVFPDGTKETILDVPEYDYNWQFRYHYPEPRPFPAGTRIEATWTFDNSELNKSNPDPSKAVDFGIETVEEMAFGFIQYVEGGAPEAGATGGGR